MSMLDIVAATERRLQNEIEIAAELRAQLDAAQRNLRFVTEALFCDQHVHEANKKMAQARGNEMNSELELSGQEIISHIETTDGYTDLEMAEKRIAELEAECDELRARLAQAEADATKYLEAK